MSQTEIEVEIKALKEQIEAEIKALKEQIEAEIKALKEQIEIMEGFLNLIIENQNDIKKLLNKQIKIEMGKSVGEIRGRKEGERRAEGGGGEERCSPEEGKKGRRGRRSLLETIELMKYLDIGEVRAKPVLNKLIEQGVVVPLEGANKTIVAAKKVIQGLLNKMPLSIDDATKMDNREYELLKVLNELGYVLKKDDKYIASELAREFLQ